MLKLIGNGDHFVYFMVTMRATSIFDINIIECELQYGEGLYLSSHLKNAADANHGTLQNYLTWEAHLD